MSSVSQIRELRKTGDYDLALKTAQFLLSQGLKTLDLYFELSLLHFFKQEFSTSQDYLSICTKNFKPKPYVLAHGVELSYHTHSPEETKSYLHLLETHYPNHFQTKYHSANYDFRVANYNKALVKVKEAVPAVKNIGQELKLDILKAKIYTHQHKHKDATVTLEKSLSLHPNNPEIIQGLIKCHAHSNNTREAKKWIAIAEKTGITSDNITIEKARLDPTLDNLGKLIKLCNQNPSYYLLHTIFALQLAHSLPHDAQETVTQTLKLYPQDMASHQNQLKLYYLNKQHQSSFNYLQKLTKAYPKNESFKINYISQLIDYGSFDNALALIKEVHTSSPSKKLATLRLRALSENGSFESAETVANQHLSHKSNNIREELSLIYLKQYQCQKTIDLIEATSGPKSSRLTQFLSLAYYLQGRVVTANNRLLKGTQTLREFHVPSYNLPVKSLISTLCNDSLIDESVQKLLDAYVSAPNNRKISLASELAIQHPHSLHAAILYLNNFKSLASTTNNDSTLSKIPKTIVQFWHRTSLPYDVQKIVDTVKENNQGYQYVRLNRSSAQRFLLNNYGKEYLEAFRQCKNSSEMSDFIRVAYLAKHGGIYIDIDDLCHTPLDNLLGRGDELILYREYIGSVGNNFIAVTPEHPVIKACMEQIKQNLTGYNKEITWLKTGPAILTKCLAQHLTHCTTSNINIMTIKSMTKYIFNHLRLEYKRRGLDWYSTAYL